MSNFFNVMRAHPKIAVVIAIIILLLPEILKSIRRIIFTFIILVIIVTVSFKTSGFNPNSVIDKSNEYYQNNQEEMDNKMQTIWDSTKDNVHAIEDILSEIFSKNNDETKGN